MGLIVPCGSLTYTITSRNLWPMCTDLCSYVISHYPCWQLELQNRESSTDCLHFPVLTVFMMWFWCSGLDTSMYAQNSTKNIQRQYMSSLCQITLCDSLPLLSPLDVFMECISIFSMVISRHKSLHSSMWSTLTTGISILTQSWKYCPIFLQLVTLYNAVNFLQNSCKRHSIAYPIGWDMVCHCRFNLWFNILPPITAVKYAISYYIGLCYNDTYL